VLAEHTRHHASAAVSAPCAAKKKWSSSISSSAVGSASPLGPRADLSTPSAEPSPLAVATRCLMYARIRSRAASALPYAVNGSAIGGANAPRLSAVKSAAPDSFERFGSPAANSVSATSKPSIDKSNTIGRSPAAIQRCTNRSQIAKMLGR
jgi:hypothetical protein